MRTQLFAALLLASAHADAAAVPQTFNELFQQVGGGQKGFETFASSRCGAHRFRYKGLGSVMIDLGPSPPQPPYVFTASAANRIGQVYMLFYASLKSVKVELYSGVTKTSEAIVNRLNVDDEQIPACY